MASEVAPYKLLETTSAQKRAARPTAAGRRRSSASQVKARAKGISESAVTCGPSPYLASTPRRTGNSFQASARNFSRNNSEGDISAVETAASHEAARDFV